MLRTLIDFTRLTLDSPGLMLLGFVVVILPGGLLLMPVLASKLKRAKVAASVHDLQLTPAVTASSQDRLTFAHAKSSVIAFVPSVGKVR